MTQAFNLSQLANKVNTSGQLDASTGLYNQTSVANGGTGKSSVTSGNLLVGAGTSAMTELAGTTTGDAVTWNGTSWVAGSVGGAPPEIQVFTSSGTWTKAAGLKKIKVTVVGAGGNGGGPGAPGSGGIGIWGGGGGGGAAIKYIPAPSIPGPVAVTAGPGTNSFGAFCSATAGAVGVTYTGGNSGIGSGGDLNIGGQDGASIGTAGAPGIGSGGLGGSSIYGGGGKGGIGSTNGGIGAGAAGKNYGGGGGGGYRSNTAAGGAGGTGAPGVVVIEEFY